MSSDRRAISERLRIAVKLSRVPGYLLAGKIHRHRSTLSGWVNRIAHPADEHAVVELGRLLGVPAAECFQDEGSVCPPAIFPWEVPSPPKRGTGTHKRLARARLTTPRSPTTSTGSRESR
jgi:hypothetical protein